MSKNNAGKKRQIAAPIPGPSTCTVRGSQMDKTPSESSFDEDCWPEKFVQMLHALNTCARGERDYNLFFEPSRERLDVLRGVLLFTDGDSSFKRRVSKASGREEITKCILKELTSLNCWRAREFAVFVQGLASVSDQKRIWTLLLKTAAYVAKKRSSSSRQEQSTHNLTFDPPVTSTPLQSGLPPEPSAALKPKGDAGDFSKKPSTCDRPRHPSSGRELNFAASGEEMPALVPGNASLEQLTTMDSRRGFSLSHVEPTVICAGGSLASLGECGSGDEKKSQQKQVPDKKMCEEAKEAERVLCLRAKSLVDDVNARLAATDTAQDPRIDFDSIAVKRIFDAACHFELLHSIDRSSK